MRPKERVEAVLQGTRPDRVPVWDINGIACSQNLGVRWKDVRDNPDLAVRVGMKFLRECGSDIIGYAGIEPNAPLSDLDMDLRFYDDNYTLVTSHLFRTAEDVDTKEFYDPKNESECPGLWKYQMEKVRLTVEREDPEEYHTQILSWSVMTTAGHLRGLEQLFMDMITEPDLAHHVMKRSAELVEGTVRTGLDLGATSV